MTSLFERRLLRAALLAWAVVAIANLILGPALGHDEAAFALIGRGDEVSWLYRSRGVTLLAELGVALGGADWQMRLVSTLIGIAVVPAVFAIGRAAFDARTGAWSAAVIVGAHPVIGRSAQLLGDLPATACVLAGVAVLVGELDRREPSGFAGPRWRIVLVAPAFAAAFYFRYASVAVIAIAGLAALAIWWPAVRARPWPVLAGFALLVALLVPHLLHSLYSTGSPLGVLRESAGTPRRAYIGEGVVTYVTANPFVYYGALVAPLLVAAFVGLARRFRSRAPWFLAVTAIGQIVALGLESHAQPRYVYVATTLLMVLGVATVRQLALPRLALVAVGLAWLGVAIGRIPYELATAHARSVLTSAAAAIQPHRSTPSCIVIAGSIPQLAWYTHCSVALSRWVGPEAFAAGQDRYVVSTPATPVDGAALAASFGHPTTELPTGDPRVRVWQVQDR